MVAVSHNIHIEQGSDFDLTVRVWSDVDQTVPENLTGWQAVMKIRPTADSPVADLTLTTGNGLTVNGPAGQVAIHMTGSQTALLNWSGYHVYDVKVYYTPDNRYKRVLQGAVFVDKEVSW